jgi:hypothetical protein
MRLLMTLAALSITALAADNSLGSWKRDVAKTKSNPPATNPIKSLTMIREANGPDGAKVTNKGIREDGAPAGWTYTVKYDGKEYPVSGDAPFDLMSWKQVDANTFTTTARKKDGKYKTTGRAVVSKDGKTFTLTTKGTNAEGQPLTQTLVYEKQ